ncbi:MAG: ABC transporter ATP-binding protein, partial [Oceanobacter sp.]
GENIHGLKEPIKTRMRNRNIGFVYQFHHLLPEFSALENTMLSCLLAGESASESSRRAMALLERLGLADRAHHQPSELSGGERQRTAIARALVNQPALVLMDEPTGNLDQNTASQVEEIMLELTEQLDTSFVLVTHDLALASRMQRCMQLKDQTLASLA